MYLQRSILTIFLGFFGLVFLISNTNMALGETLEEAKARLQELHRVFLGEFEVLSRSKKEAERDALELRFRNNIQLFFDGIVDSETKEAVRPMLLEIIRQLSPEIRVRDEDALAPLSDDISDSRPLSGMHQRARANAVFGDEEEAVAAAVVAAAHMREADRHEKAEAVAAAEADEAGVIGSDGESDHDLGTEGEIEESLNSARLEEALGEDNLPEGVHPALADRMRRNTDGRIVITDTTGVTVIDSARPDRLFVSRPAGVLAYRGSTPAEGHVAVADRIRRTATHAIAPDILDRRIEGATRGTQGGEAAAVAEDRADTIGVLRADLMERHNNAGHMSHSDSPSALLLLLAPGGSIDSTEEGDVTDSDGERGHAQLPPTVTTDIAVRVEERLSMPPPGIIPPLNMQALRIRLGQGMAAGQTLLAPLSRAPATAKAAQVLLLSEHHKALGHRDRAFEIPEVAAPPQERELGFEGAHAGGGGGALGAIETDAARHNRMSHLEHNRDGSYSYTLGDPAAMFAATRPTHPQALRPRPVLSSPLPLRAYDGAEAPRHGSSYLASLGFRVVICNGGGGGAKQGPRGLSDEDVEDGLGDREGGVAAWRVPTSPILGEEDAAAHEKGENGGGARARPKPPSFAAHTTFRRSLLLARRGLEGIAAPLAATDGVTDTATGGHAESPAPRHRGRVAITSEESDEERMLTGAMPQAIRYGRRAGHPMETAPTPGRTAVDLEAGTSPFLPTSFSPLYRTMENAGFQGAGRRGPTRDGMVMLGEGDSDVEGEEVIVPGMVENDEALMLAVNRRVAALDHRVAVSRLRLPVASGAARAHTMEESAGASSGTVVIVTDVVADMVTDESHSDEVHFPAVRAHNREGAVMEEGLPPPAPLPRVEDAIDALMVRAVAPGHGIGRGGGAAASGGRRVARPLTAGVIRSSSSSRLRGSWFPDFPDGSNGGSGGVFR
ncbi:MAG: hypothetical protein J0G29_02760 [Alphaproteobacteria bacterium]|nr:hypothetical protein [Alphaproteobacteria bacterium]OJV46350.1 MAG: hypothetical protein BGO28_03225 [Alphaproteobacteria bacterium 43-37]